MKDNFHFIMPLAINMIRYFLLAGFPFLIFYVFFPNSFARNKIQAQFAKRKDFIREILYSLQTTFVLVAVGLLIIKSPLKEYTRFYQNSSDYSLWWIPFSVLLALVVHDTYFYWMHRLVHHPKLYKRVHLIHHKSINPSPWASYSFHINEAILEAMIAPIVLILIPMHPLALVLFTFSSFAINVYGHLGYEIAPKWFRYSILFEILNTSTHHNIHHSKFNGNYGLYFRAWDRIMGTEHPDYVKDYDVIQKKRYGSEIPNPIPWKSALFIVFTLSIGIVLISAISPLNIEGIWHDKKGGGTILIYKENGLYFGQLIAADNSEENKKISEHSGNIVMMKNFKKKSRSEYCCGTIYQPREKRTISATIIMEDLNTLKINGIYGIFKRSRKWYRSG